MELLIEIAVASDVIIWLIIALAIQKPRMTVTMTVAIKINMEKLISASSKIFLLLFIPNHPIKAINVIKNNKIPKPNWSFSFIDKCVSIGLLYNL